MREEREEPVVTDLIADELQLIRNSVPGVRGSISATTDGLAIAHDVPGLEPTQDFPAVPAAPGTDGGEPLPARRPRAR